MLLMLLIHLIEEEGAHNKEKEMLLMVWSTQSNQKNSKALCPNFLLDLKRKNVKITMKLTKQI